MPCGTVFGLAVDVCCKVDVPGSWWRFARVTDRAGLSCWFGGAGLLVGGV